MNRLVLIGNGFDLSHNLKTSYKDFLYWYLKKVLDCFFSNSFYEDKLIELHSKSSINGLPKMETLDDLINVLNVLKHKRDSNLSIKYKSQFFQEIIELHQHKKWVDLENHYFSYLTRSMNNDSVIISKLNEEFEYLKSELENYLTIVVNSNRPIQNPAKFDFLLNDVPEDCLIDLKPKYPTYIENIYILNFNYTPTFNEYANFLNSKKNTSINFIHGELNSTNNPIIFGFGDEHNEEYKKFENKKDNYLFEHIKSFKYLRTSNYQDLVRFIDGNEFQVCIMGHSCGLSDRTMLKEIFEHENCKSILVYYHKRGTAPNENDYTERTYEISRHFTDKGMMRKKVVSFDKSKPL
ncbi:MAG: hypothetical protein KA210_06175 [Bacteroidia bacterium]|nr:hypothetical protein [Bacteroidia bacterium]